MTSFELFRLLKFKKYLYFIYICILFSSEIYYVCQDASFGGKKSNILYQIGYNSWYHN